MADEEITSLPWLLERVAGRLELLSHRIKEEEAKGRKENQILIGSYRQRRLQLPVLTGKQK